MTTDNVQKNLVDHVAVRHLVDRYTDALNHLDWKTLAETFHDDAVWLVNGPRGELQQQIEGRAQIVASIRELIEDSGGGDVIQMNHATTVDVVGDGATVRSTMESSHWLPDGTRHLLYASYTDDVARGDDGEWRFVRRQWRTKAMFDVGS